MYDLQVGLLPIMINAIIYTGEFTRRCSEKFRKVFAEESGTFSKFQITNNKSYLWYNKGIFSSYITGRE